MDEKFTNKLQAYMAQPEADRDTMEGATLLLQLNRNRILFQNITRRPEKFRAKLFYELNKYLTIRLDNQTMADVARMDKEVDAIVTPGTLGMALEAVNVGAVDEQGHIAYGKREDHNELPDAIQALYVENGALGRKLITLHERLKELNTAASCDRYPFLKEMIEIDKLVRSNWEKYDSFDLNVYKSAQAANAGKTIDTPPADAIKKVNAARKYLSDNKAKLAALKDDATQLAKYTELLTKMQQRYDLIIATGENVSDEQKAELVNAGLTV